MKRILKTLIASSTLLLVASPTLANVKTGVDAWERGDFSAAVKEWRPLAIKGDADAQFNLAQAYRFGRGVPLDMRQAEEWYRKAATQGHFQAEDNLGLIMFQNGNTQAAMPIIERSANRGEPRAEYVYGTALFNGELVQQNWPRAYAYMTRASASGLSSASAALAQMDQHIPLEQRQQGLTISRQLEAQAGRAKFAQNAPASGISRPAPPPMQQPRQAPQIASNDGQPSWGGPPASVTPAPVVIPQQRSTQQQPSRGQAFPNNRGALPSPRASSRPMPKPQSGEDMMDQPGDVQGGNAGYPAQPYPQSQPYPQPQSYPQQAQGVPNSGYPSDTYPQQTYPQQTYPQQTYPSQSYPAQTYPSQTYPTDTYPRVQAAPRPLPTRRPVAPAPQMVRKPVAPTPSATTAGAWRVQLGAFSTPGAADTLWKSLRGRVPALGGKQPYLVKSGAITRLQAGSYASRSAAESACSAVRATGNGCMVTGR
jgi:uncharacterized protein